MVRPLRIEYPGAVYHLTTRGNARNNIYRDEQDRKNHLFILADVVKKYNWLCHAYCLMGNHYHLLVETPEANLSQGMRQLNGIYTQRYNKRHNHVGHVFQGRYKAILVDKENYLLELCRYIVLNPVRIQLVDLPEHWPWGSYRSTSGLTGAPDFLTVDWILGMFGNNRRLAQQKYQQFVREGMDSKSPFEALKGQVLLGNTDFVEQCKDLFEEKGSIKEIARNQRNVGRPGLQDVFADYYKMSKGMRNEKMYEAHVKYGYRLKEIADQLGVHYATVSRAVRKVDKNIVLQDLHKNHPNTTCPPHPSYRMVDDADIK